MSAQSATEAYKVFENTFSNRDIDISVRSTAMTESIMQREHTGKEYQVNDHLCCTVSHVK